MALLRRVVSAFDRIAPLRLAESWDNVGVLLEAPFPREGAKGILLTIDLTPEVLSEALILDDVGVIVAYHPTIFRGWKSLTLAPEGSRDAEKVKQEMILTLAAKGISVYSPHSSLDACQDGLSDWLASGLAPLGIASIAPVSPTDASTPESPEGNGRIVTLSTPAPLSSVVTAIKAHLGLPHLRLAESMRGHAVSTIALCAGSGISVVTKAASRADLYWTGEMGHHEVLASVATGTHVVLCEHTNTERGYLRAGLLPRLQRELGPDVAIHVSNADRDPLVIV
ncbi:NGG1 interacting factor 3-like protein [Blastocladiella britannica]|nr:NGG1 interacting factor 3-like protein [Blastocladiella britannica]